MPGQEFHLEVTNQSVYVRLDVSTQSAETRSYALAFFVGFTVLGLCALLFLPGKHGRKSMWHGLSTSSVGSAEFLFPLFLLLGFPLVMVVGTKRYVMSA